VESLRKNAENFFQKWIEITYMVISKNHLKEKKILHLTVTKLKTKTFSFRKKNII